MKPRLLATPRQTRGFTLIEMLVAVVLGMLLVIAATYVYLNTKTAFARQQQLSSLQDAVRVAFDLLAVDARGVGQMGCFTGSTIGSANFVNDLSTTDPATNFNVGVQGYSFKTTSAADSVLRSGTANALTNFWWPPIGIIEDPLYRLPPFLIPWSDVLILRTASGPPARLAENSDLTSGTGVDRIPIAIEPVNAEAGGEGTCRSGTVKVSGFCPTSYGVIATCRQARVFQASGLSAAPTSALLSLPAVAAASHPSFNVAETEVFPLQTVVYYVLASSNKQGSSLYRRIIDGDHPGGLDQELLEGVETMQISYGVDTSTPPDGTVDTYVKSTGPSGGLPIDSVTDWSRVVAVRVNLLVRATDPVSGDLTATMPESAVVDGRTFTFESRKFDRRLFAATFAIRNKAGLK